MYYMLTENATFNLTITLWSHLNQCFPVEVIYDEVDFSTDNTIFV